MIEKILLWLLLKIFNWLKKKYPNGDINNYALIETDKLSEQVKSLIQNLTPEEVESQIMTQAKTDINKIVDIVKSKIGGNK